MCFCKGFLGRAAVKNIHPVGVIDRGRLVRFRGGVIMEIAVG